MSKEKYPEHPILIVDDEEDFRNTIKATLGKNGITNVELCKDSLEVMANLKSKKYSIILLDILMPGIRGDELLPKILKEHPGQQIVLLTALGEEAVAMECLKKGATDYIVKGSPTYQMIYSIEKSLKHLKTQKENISLKESLLSETLKHPEAFQNIVTKNEKMKNMLKLIEIYAKSPEPVLITGETGVGKELIARAIHDASEREGNFIPINVASLDNTLFTDTLFGHKKGAFTYAIQNRNGLIQEAEGGTLFLDEIGYLDKKLQVVLLRFFQEKEYLPLGADKTKITNTRLVAATNRDLKKMMENGDFGEDLYYRLNCHSIHIPPLRERKDDTPLLVNHFVDKASKKQKKEINNVPGKLFAMLSYYDFPGNIRELEAMINDAVIRSETETLCLDTFYEKLPPHPEEDSNHLEIAASSVNENPPDDNSYCNCDDLKKAYGENEKSCEHYKARRVFIIKEALKRNKNNKSRVAELLDIPRSTINNILNIAPIRRQKKEDL